MTEPQAPKHTALLPCPFCGGEAQVGNIVRDMTSMSVACCSSCGGQTVAQPWWRYGRDAEPKAQAAAIEAWNRRAPVSAIKPDPSSSAQEVRAALERLRADIADDVRYLSDIKRTEYGDGSLDAKKGILTEIDKALASAPPTSKGDRT